MKEQLIFLGFVAGLIFCATYTSKGLLEGFNDSNGESHNEVSDCPNLLVKKGNKLMLLNNRKARIPGVNPIFFDNLEDYVEFVEWQRSQDIKCPVLYFNEMQDTQGNTRFRMLNDPSDPQAGLPSHGGRMAEEVPLYDANMDHSPYNQNTLHGFDPNNQNAGRYTSLDKAFYKTTDANDNPMNMKWAGAEASRRMVKSGKYNKDRPTDKFSKFKGITIPPTQPGPKGQTSAPTSAGAKTGDAEKDQQLKREGRL